MNMVLSSLKGTQQVGDVTQESALRLTVPGWQGQWDNLDKVVGLSGKELSFLLEVYMVLCFESVVQKVLVTHPNHTVWYSQAVCHQSTMPGLLFPKV